MRLLIATCLLTAFVSGVLLAQLPDHQTLECNPQANNCGSVVLSGPTAQTNRNDVIHQIIPSPVWVADPSAGHYDCPDGWTAYTRSEPEVFQAIFAVPAIGHQPRLDKKGHALEEQPSVPICIQEKP